MCCQAKTDNGSGTHTDPNCPAFSPCHPCALQHKEDHWQMGERGGHSGRECSVGIKKQSKLSFLGLVFDYHFFLSSGVWIKNDIKSKKCCLVFFFSVFQLWSLSTSCDLDCVLPTGSYRLWGSVKSAFQTFGTREHMTSTGPDSVHWLPFLKSALWLSRHIHLSQVIFTSQQRERGRERVRDGGRGGNSGDPSSGRAKTEGHYNVITSSTTDPELPEGWTLSRTWRRR